MLARNISWHEILQSRELNWRATEPGRGKEHFKPAMVAADDNREKHFAFRFKGFIVVILD